MAPTGVYANACSSPQGGALERQAARLQLSTYSSVCARVLSTMSRVFPGGRRADVIGYC